jgi:hypothetical protein
MRTKFVLCPVVERVPAREDTLYRGALYVGFDLSTVISASLIGSSHMTGIGSYNVRGTLSSRQSSSLMMHEFQSILS